MERIYVFAFLTFCAFTGLSFGQDRWEKVIGSAAGKVLTVAGVNSRGDQIGTAFAASPSQIITTWQFAANNQAMSLVGPNKKSVAVTSVAWASKSDNLVVLTVDPVVAPWLAGLVFELASAGPSLGAEIVAIGNSSAQDRSAIVSRVTSVLKGPPQLVEFSASLAPSAGGGPVLNDSGQVVAVIVTDSEPRYSVASPVTRLRLSDARQKHDYSEWAAKSVSHVENAIAQDLSNKVQRSSVEWLEALSKKTPFKDVADKTRDCIKVIKESNAPPAPVLVPDKHGLLRTDSPHFESLVIVGEIAGANESDLNALVAKARNTLELAPGHLTLMRWLYYLEGTFTREGATLAKHIQKAGGDPLHVLHSYSSLASDLGRIGPAHAKEAELLLLSLGKTNPIWMASPDYWNALVGTQAGQFLWESDQRRSDSEQGKPFKIRISKAEAIHIARKSVEYSEQHSSLLRAAGAPRPSAPLAWAAYSLEQAYWANPQFLETALSIRLEDLEEWLSELGDSRSNGVGRFFDDGVYRANNDDYSRELRLRLEIISNRLRAEDKEGLQAQLGAMKSVFESRLAAASKDLRMDSAFRAETRNWEEGFTEIQDQISEIK